MNALGIHLLLELRSCDSEKLDNLPLIREALLSAAREVGATVLGHTFHKFSPQGVTGVIAIAESHFCIHTWPEFAYAAVDIFTCGESFHPGRAAEIIVQKLDCKEPTILEMKRGVRVAVPALSKR